MSKIITLRNIMTSIKEAIKCDAMNFCAYGDSYFDDLKDKINRYEEYKKELELLINENIKNNQNAFEYR